jgi:predicted N-acetyltransferase YhbS
MSLPITTRPLADTDLPAVAALHAAVFGPGRFARSAYRVREGTADISRYCRIAVHGDRIIAAVRMTPIRIGGSPGALLLGPLAVDPDFANQGHGRRLVAESMEAAKAEELRIVLLIGDEPYYARLGFVRVPPNQIRMPAPWNPARMLAAELQPGALVSYTGLVTADRG